jgi:2-C-methyl-D-erythritol 2,4-cyclodiphosphate synthase
VNARIGTGYDLHRFGDDRRLVLGGVHFDGERGLVGHSDADVLTHAIVDALLGAAGLGDIGMHFPSSDERFAGANSIALLRQTLDLLAEHDWKPINIDTTVIAEHPKLEPRVAAIRASLAQAMCMDVGDVSVKAKTNDQTGAIGAGEAIAAMAVALIERRSESQSGKI